MDGQRFDTLTRAISATESRRTFVKLLAGGAFAGLVTRIGLEEAGAKEAPICRRHRQGCRRDDQCCGGSCRAGRCRCGADQRRCGDRLCCGPTEVCQKDLEHGFFCLDLRL